MCNIILCKKGEVKPHKSQTQTQLTVMGFPLCALDYPWSTPSLPGSGVREASLSTADSSPQPASPSLWKVSLNHCGGGGQSREEGKGGRWRRQWGWWWGGEWLGTTACLPCRVGRMPWLSQCGTGCRVKDGCLDGRERVDGDRSPVRSKQDEREGCHLYIRATKHVLMWATQVQNKMG